MKEKKWNYWFVSIYNSFIASALGTATIVSVATVSCQSRSVFIASFSLGASTIVTAS
jgi:hypothetical protein